MILAGDFNSQGASGVRELLVTGEVTAAFRESGDPTEPRAAELEVTSKPKRHPFGAFADVAEIAEIAEQGAPPRRPTIVGQELMSEMLAADGAPSAKLTAALDAMFEAFSSDRQTLSAEEERAWLLAINRSAARGSEMRAAKAAREARGGDAAGARLTRQDFHAIYTAELVEGKFWGVEHDLRAVLGTGLASPTALPFTATFDYIYFTTASLRLERLVPPLSEEQYAALLRPGGETLPNAWLPSDHLPVAAALEFAAVGEPKSE